VLPKSHFLLHRVWPCAIFSSEAKNKARQGFIQVSADAQICGFRKNFSKTKVQRGETMTRRFVTGALVGALASVFAAGAAAQANPTNSGYWLFGYGTPDANVWRNSNFGDPKIGNLCWRTGYWAPSMAIVECDPDLVPKPAPAPAVAPPPPPPPPAPAPAPAPAPQVQKITLAVEGAVRLRQGRAEARRQGGDRFRDH
jgi:hypothetical protein